MTGPPGPTAPGLLTAAASFLLARGVQQAHRAGQLPGGSARWERRNHRDEPVTLTEGVALAAGAGLPLLLVDPPAAVVVAGSATAGAVDDLAGYGDGVVLAASDRKGSSDEGGSGAKGLRGHLGALRRGTVTTGVLKIAGLLGTGVLAATWSDHRQGRALGAHTLAGAALVAGAANLANLFDLRPGRALKVALACGIPLFAVGRPAAAAITGAGLAVLSDDLAARSMLGDTGANPLGASVGIAAAQQLSPRGRWVALACVTGLTLLSERISFTRVIESTPVLRELDRWGRG